MERRRQRDIEPIHPEFVRPGDPPPSIFKGILLFVLVGGAVALLILLIGNWIIGLRGHGVLKVQARAARAAVWQQCEARLPDDAGRVTFLRKPMHAFLPKYERKLVLDTKAPNGTEIPLSDNPGVATRVSLYWYAAEGGKGPFLVLRDPIGEYAIDVRRGSAWRVIRTADGVYAAPIVSGKEELGWDLDTDGVARRPRLGGTPAEKITDSYAASGGAYLGRIVDQDGRPVYLTPAASPEKAAP